MNLDLSGKNALVCGSSRGIGKAAAFELARLGANVTLVARSAEKLATVREELAHSQGQHHDFLVMDFNKPEEVREKVENLITTHPIHILINNTGGPPGGPITEAKPEAFLAAFQQHLICNQIITQAVLPGMQAAGYGRVINVISTSVKQPLNGLGVSNTVRGAVANWAKTMANEVGKHGITVNNVLPGATATDRLQDIIANKAKKSGKSEAEVADQMRSSIPVGRFGQPEELGNAIAFLASPAAAYISGINLPVDGGRTKCL